VIKRIFRHRISTIKGEAVIKIQSILDIKGICFLLEIAIKRTFFSIAVPEGTRLVVRKSIKNVDLIWTSNKSCGVMGFLGNTKHTKKKQKCLQKVIEDVHMSFERKRGTVASSREFVTVNLFLNPSWRV
jgi:hypothetical protein